MNYIKELEKKVIKEARKRCLEEGIPFSVPMKVVTVSTALEKKECGDYIKVSMRI